MTANPLEAISAAARGGDFPMLERLCRAALADQPGRGDFLFFLAVSLQYQNKLDQAIEIYARLTEVFAGDAVHWGNYGTALREGWRLDEAEKAYAEATRLAPKSAAPLINEGLLLIQRGDYLAAREKMLDAVDVEPDLPRARVHAAIACSMCQDFDRAEKLLKPWRDWLPLGDDALQIDLSNQLLLFGNGPAAELVLEEIVRRDPRNVQARLRLATYYERVNRLDDAEVITREVAADLPLADLLTRRAIDHGLGSLAVRRGDLATARQLYENAGPRTDEDYAYFFNLAEVYDKLREYDLAMEALKNAHALKVEEMKRIAPEQFEPGAPALPTAVPDVTADAYRNWPVFQAPDARNSPIFIVGFPRSGTTLLEQMLDAHPGLQSMDENPYFNRLADTLRRHDSRILGSLDVLRQFDCDELRKQYLLMVTERIQRRWDTQLVDKNPLNMLWLPFIHRLFPNARHILAIRHPCDVILSCYMQNFRSAILVTASETLERLASAYVAAMRCWLTHVEVFQPNVLISRYEDVVADLPGQAKKLAGFLELADATPMLRFDQHAREKGYIGTPSYSQVIEPVNTKAMNRWLRYRPYFDKALPILEPMLKHWGYTAE